MQRIMQRISLPDSKPSPFCRATWNEEKQQFERRNSYETIRCCLETCRPHIDFCYRQCNGDRSCNILCKQLIDTCENGCYSMPSPAFDTMFNCLDSDEEVKQCGSFPLFDKDCLEKHKENILKCCEENCTECDKNKTCPSMFNFVKNDYRSTFDDLIRSDKNESGENIEGFAMKPREIFLFEFALVVFFFVVLFLCFCKKN
jgi:hypothetical protein